MKRMMHKLMCGVIVALCLYSVNVAQQSGWPGLLEQNLSPSRLNRSLKSGQTQTGPLDIEARETFNVRLYGAKGNGKWDDTEAIRTAVRAIEKAGGGKLFFPNGSYAVSSSIDLPSGITIEGTNGAYNGNCQIRLTVPGQKIFTIGENRRRITIRDIELKAAPQSVTPYKIMDNTIAIDAKGRAPQSSFEIEFSNLTITGFDRGISVTDASGAAAWQFDNVLVDHCTFAENNYGLYIDSQNADYWKISNSWFGIRPGGYGVYLRQSGFFTIDTSIGGGPPRAKALNQPFANAFIYVGGAHGTLTIINSQCEEVLHFLELVEPSNYTYPITIINSIVGPPITLRANCIFVSIGNLYGANTVETVDKATDVLIHSIGDVAESPVNSGKTPMGASPFKLQYNSRVVFGSSIYRVDFGNPATFSRGVGVGIDPARDALLSIATPNDNGILLRLGNTQGYYYDVYRDTKGYLNFQGNQQGYIGFRFNGDIVPTSNRAGKLGDENNRWGSVSAVKVVSGDAVLSDKETGEELYRIREDQQNIYFEDIRTGKQMMRLDREGNLHVKGKIYENSN